MLIFGVLTRILCAATLSAPHRAALSAPHLRAINNNNNNNKNVYFYVDPFMLVVYKLDLFINTFIPNLVINKVVSLLTPVA